MHRCSPKIIPKKICDWNMRSEILVFNHSRYIIKYKATRQGVEVADAHTNKQNKTVFDERRWEGRAGQFGLAAHHCQIVLFHQIMFAWQFLSVTICVTGKKEKNIVHFQGFSMEKNLQNIKSQISKIKSHGAGITIFESIWMPSLLSKEYLQKFLHAKLWYLVG